MYKSILRNVTGVFLLLVGLNKFFAFMPPPELNAEAGKFMASLIETGYMIPMIGGFEILCGALLLFAITAPLGVILLAPISVNIAAFHFFLDVNSGTMGFVLLALNVALGVIYFSYYRSIFAGILTEKVFITHNHRGDKPTHKPVAVIT